MIEKYKQIKDLPEGAPTDEDAIPFVQISTNTTMRAPRASLRGAKIVAAEIVGDDIEFTLNDTSKVIITNAKLAIKGDTGASITSGAFEVDDIVFLKDDGTTVTLANAKAILKGDKGDAATIALGTVQTGEAGSEVSITNTGTPGAATFNFIIPRGNKGETGAKVTSVAFSGNDIVFTLNDTTTVTLTDAKLDLKGDVGAKITNAAFSGNDIVFTLDDTSTATLVGGKTILTGPKGDIGLTGRGVTSIEKTGTAGLVDTYTITYSDETTSSFTVTNGLDGTNGTDGIDGDDAYVYIAYASDANGTGFTTTFNANLDYVAIKNTTTPIASPQASDFTGLWKKYKGETGEPGPTGTSFIWAQTYNPAVTYPVNRVVAYNGSSYICIQESTGNLPTNETYWNLVAQRGLDGEGSGDVIGPASATNKGVALFDTTTGKLLKNSTSFVQLDNGSVGIGTTNPLTGLHIATTGHIGTAGYGYSLLIQPSASNFGARFALNTLNSANAVLMGESVNGAGDFSIKTSSDSNLLTRTGTFTDRFIIKNGGNVGIGTTSPTEKLQVSGNIKATGTVVGTNLLYTALKGASNGLAELDTEGKVPASQLPSYVDDVVEYADSLSFPAIGESGKIYIALDTNKTYRWSGTVYVTIGSDLALGETSASAYRGDKGKVAYDHSQLLSGNPHGVSKADVGLENVDNTTDAEKPVSTAQQEALDAKASLAGAAFTGPISLVDEWLTKHFSIGPHGDVAIRNNGVTSGASLMVGTDYADLYGILVKGTENQNYDLQRWLDYQNNVLARVDKDGNITAPNLLTKDNEVEFTPTNDYHPATKKYVDDNAGGTAMDPTNLIAPTAGYLTGGVLKILTCDILVVAGGGGAGASNSTNSRNNGGGGGAGGLININNYLLYGGAYSVIVGGGGAGASSGSVKGGNGSDSLFSALTAKGGGGGGSDSNMSGASGGSGGGAGSQNNSTTAAGGSGIQPSQSEESGTYGYGNNGGNTNPSGAGAGSGGGAGGPGASAAYQSSGGVAGGVGLEVFGTVYSTGGSGGAGDGSSGQANTGNGGNVNGAYSTGPGGDGGSGIVIVRYLTANAVGLTVTGGTITTEGEYTLHTFTSDGTFSVTNSTVNEFESLRDGINDGKFKINIDGIEYDNVAVDLTSVIDLDDVASAVQAGIRTATSGTETCIFDGVKFVITSATSGKSSKILKLMTPSTGTDISGAGATPYLNCAANATETHGDDDAGKTVILDALGELTIRKYTLSALNTAPASVTDTGTLGEIRVTADYIYICTATNTWKRVAITTW